MLTVAPGIRALIGLAVNILGAILPALVLIAFFNRLDRKRPEPRGLILKSVLFGFLAVLPAVIVELILERFLPRLGGLADAAVKGFLVAGLVEEGVKFAFVSMWIYARKEFDEVADGIVYTVCVSLGFALVENVMYSFGSTATMVVRAFTAVPMHAAASGVMGYYIGLSKRGGRDRRALGLLAAVGIHGIYDFFAFSGGWMALLIVPVVIASFILVVRLFKRALAMDDQAAKAAESARPAMAPAVEGAPEPAFATGPGDPPTAPGEGAAIR